MSKKSRRHIIWARNYLWSAVAYLDLAIKELHKAKDTESSAYGVDAYLQVSKLLRKIKTRLEK